MTDGEKYTWRDYVKLAFGSRKQGKSKIASDDLVKAALANGSVSFSTTLTPAQQQLLNALTPEKTPVPNKPRYSSYGMNGFSENGPDDDMDMSLGFVRGYRWWKWSIPAALAGWKEAPPYLDSHEWKRLCGANGMCWPDGKVEATCTKGAAAPTWDDLIAGRKVSHEVPEYRTPCGCGFWSYWPPDCPSAVGTGTTNGRDGAFITIPVFGAVKAYGRIIIGEKGMRSQFAEIEALCLPSEAVECLGLWHVPHRWGSYDTEFRFEYSSRSTFDSITGRAPASAAYRDVMPATPEEILSRCATLETALGKLYPSAKVVSTRDLLVKMFPPDKTYYESRSSEELYP